MKLAKSLCKLFPRGEQLAGTDLYQKYKVLGDAIHMSAGMLMLFWFSVTVCMVTLVVAISINKPQYFGFAVMLMLMVIGWLIAFDRHQTPDMLMEAEFAGEAIECIRQGSSRGNCSLILNQLALSQRFAEQGMGGVLKRERLRFDVHLAIFRAAGHKVGERKDYFDGK